MVHQTTEDDQRKRSDPSDPDNVWNSRYYRHNNTVINTVKISSDQVLPLTDCVMIQGHSSDHRYI